ncbi:MAG: 2-amino-4-hydroxy-6-hydroxymethyldihydropteridine diphosphokinase [Actinomycetota bacterium]
MPAACISLGCNLGDCRANLEQALKRLGDNPQVAVTAVSSVYVTEPVGVSDQPDFRNMAAVLETELSPRQLFVLCRTIEEELGGREGREPMGPRTIDLDILLYEEVEISEEDLKIPHPRMLDRAFVLVPLAEIAPDLRLPGGMTAAAAAGALEDPHWVRSEGPLPGLEPGEEE